MLDFILAPMDDTSWTRPAGQRRQSQFRVDWRQTLRDLEREVDHLKGRDVTIHLAVLPSALRRDRTGLLANQYAGAPVIVTFETKDRGQLAFRSDRFVNDYHSGMSSWRHNVRAVSLTLESLRAADRYGCLEAGEQYEGLKALPAGSSAPIAAGPGDRRAAAELLVGRALPDTWTPDDVERVLAPGDYAAALLKQARRTAHPDRGGDRAAWDALEAAARTLGLL